MDGNFSVRFLSIWLRWLVCIYSWQVGGMMCDANWLKGSWCGVEYVWGKGQGKKGLRRCWKGNCCGERVEPCGCGGGCDGGGKLSVDGEEDLGRESLISFKKKLSNAK